MELKYVKNHSFHSKLFIVLDFSGNTDVVIPVTSTRYSISALKLPTLSPWRAWYDDGEVSDCTMSWFLLDYLVLLLRPFYVI